MTHPITACRICSSPKLPAVLDLGRQALTGVFPTKFGSPVLTGDLRVVRCDDCGLAQLDRTYPLDEMYAPGYGYQSSLNASMKRHLFSLAEGLWRYVPDNGVVVDIGSNDGTLLGYMPGALRIGVDPLAHHMRERYPRDAAIVADFFPSSSLTTLLRGHSADVVTSVAMFYDLESPVAFARAVAEILAPDGVWLTEQAYTPDVIGAGVYDFICHEHVEYYTLADMRHVADAAGLKIIGTSTNDTNGGSFTVTFARLGAKYRGLDDDLDRLIEKEEKQVDRAAWDRFAAGVERHAAGIKATLQRFHDDGIRVLGYGASTKGNVLLQRAGITTDLLPAIAEVNPSKWGCYTPGTGIPIISEAAARERKPEVFFVLPWHFRASIVEREREFLAAGGSLFFPFPKAEVVDGHR